MAKRGRPRKGEIRPKLGRPKKVKEELEPNPDRKERHCLKCNDQFLSEWAGNRLCPICGRANMEEICRTDTVPILANDCRHRKRLET